MNKENEHHTAPDDEAEGNFGEPLPFEEIREKTDRYILGTYKRLPVAFYFGQGEYLYDTEQRRYLDFVSGIAVTSLGHCEADLIAALREQADRLWHTSNLYYNQEQALLAEALINHSFPGKAFFCNSGTEANEAAFKLARRYGNQKKGGAGTVLSLNNSFHGRTLAGMTLTGQAKIQKGFGSLVPGIEYIPPNDIEALEKILEEHASDIAALFLELVQGEGGVRPLEVEYVRAARELTREHDILLIVDEVQTGVGRTGRLFAYEHFDIEPDLLTLAKGLGGGFPIGALIVAERYCRHLEAGAHGSTFGGNHLASRIAFETLRIIIGREILQNVVAVSEYIFRRLNLTATALSVIREVRGLGLLIGIELERPGQVLVDACRERGLLINCCAENTIRLLPPLNISLEEASRAMDILEEELRTF